PPELCFDMGLVLHELATNSAKYGTLGREEGAISVKWTFLPRPDGSTVFCFDWDDPLSTYAEPTKGGGFGSKLIGALVERKWNGTVTIAQTSNFRISMEVPLDPGRVFAAR
ncbi:MAG: sensor histidine kinase, partial [Mesorhizobium sp.]|nr:sensor histidine kinase [Mesorhizobium sp.]